MYVYAIIIDFFESTKCVSMECMHYTVQLLALNLCENPGIVQ